MHKRTSVFVATFLGAWLLSGRVHGQSGRPIARAHFSDAPLTIDGRLDEPAWREALESGDFVERSPTLGGEPPVRTTFRVLFDREAITFGIFCADDRPHEIRALTRSRDASAIFRDDVISVKLDPTLDHRTTLGFAVNPAGARLDYRGIDESDFRIEYDSVWQGAASLVAGGWSAELRIPYAALEIDPQAPPAEVGLNFSRDHSRRSATYDWSLLAPPFSPIAASRYGVLVGLDELGERLARSGAGEDADVVRSFAVIPYARTGFRRAPGPDGDALLDESLLNGGVDVKAEIGRVRGHLTVNTDFAQVDLDNQVVNLTRFGLFLPEKRDFFLQDLEIFSFGRPQEAQMLYSRRIGLDVSGGEVPILEGTKVVGRPSDELRVGLLQVTTQPRGDQPWTSSSVGRGLIELGGGSNAGFMVAQRQSLEEGADQNLMVGVDGAWRGQGVPLLVQSFAMGSFTGTEASAVATAAGGDGARTSDRLAPGAGVSVALRDPLVQPQLAYAFYHPELRGDLGFFQRVGVHRGDASLEIEPRIDAGGLSKLELIGSGSVFAATDDGRLLDWRATGETALTWDAGYQVGAAVTHRAETLDASFTVGRNTTIEAGEYRMWVASLFGYTPPTYALSASTYLTGRDYYGGTLLEADGTLSWAPASLLRFDLGSTYDHVTFETLPDFDSFVLNGRVHFGFTNELSVRLFGGYNLLGDVLQLQNRLRWLYAPGSDLILVQQVNLEDDSFTPVLVSIIAKASFYWSP